MTRLGGDARADGTSAAPLEPNASDAAATPPGLRVWLLSFAVMSLLSVLWALASPVFSIPDENAHAVKAIAQLQGQVIGRSVEGVRHLVVDLAPEDAYSGDILCYATHPEVPADCGSELGDPGGQDWYNTWVGTYNPLYYYLVGWPTLFLDGNAGIYAMRIVSALIGSAFVAFAFQLAVAGRRGRWLPLGVAFAAAPMNVYLMGAVNPSGLEIAASVSLWVAALRLFEGFATDGASATARVGTSRTTAWAIATASAIAVANARALGPLWVLLIVGFAALLVGWTPVRRLFTTRASYPWLAAIAVGGAFSLLWTFVGGALSNQAEPGDAPLVGASPLAGAVYVLRTTPGLLQQAAGWFGWLDTPLPVPTYWLIAAAVAVPVTLALTAVRRRSAIVFGILLAAALLVPILVQARSVSQTGIIWQGRYGLPLYLGVLIVACWVLSAREARRIAHLAPRVGPLVAASIAAFGVYAFWLVMMRYVIGQGAPLRLMWSDPSWQPPGGWPLLVILYVAGSAALVALVAWLCRIAARHDPDELASVDVDVRTVDVRG